MPSDALSLALDRLYGAPLEDFLTLRKQLVGELRAAGEGAASKVVATAPKPTRTAWALNQVSRRQPELLEALLRARDPAFAPAAGDAAGLRRTMRDYRERLSDVVRAARDQLAESGVELSAIQSRRLTETLHAACAEEGGTRSQLLRGTLARDAEADDPLALLAAGGTGPSPRAPDPSVERQRSQERREREQHAAATAAARIRVTELESVAREALARLRAAQAETERARHSCDEADARLAEAREKVARLESARFAKE